jgi:hypothetical protein
MKQILGAAALAATTVLAVPALAFAHGSVYQSTAYTGAGLTLETRYFVTNHGYSYLLKETNGITDASGADAKKGMVAYNFAPSAWRSPQGGTKKTFAEVMTQAGTAAQPHATCLGAPGLESEAAIKSWQDDPFYNYVPFQSESAGLEDDPAKWLATLAGVGVTSADLATVDSRTAKCAALGGTYTKADDIATQASALAEGLTKPIQERFNVATASNTTLTAQVAALTTEVNALKTQVSGMQAAATPIKLTVASAKAKTVASKGVVVSVNAQARKAVTVTVSLTEAQARKLKLASSLLGKKTVTTDASGNASATVKVSKAAAKALKALKTSVSVTIEATSGDRFATANSKFTR